MLRHEFASLADERMVAVRRTIWESAEVLQSTETFFDASEEVRREEFSAFVNPLLARHPEVYMDFCHFNAEGHRLLADLIVARAEDILHAAHGPVSPRRAVRTPIRP